jgi:hypothetical protein
MGEIVRDREKQRKGGIESSNRKGEKGRDSERQGERVGAERER